VRDAGDARPDGLECGFAALAVREHMLGATSLISAELLVIMRSIGMAV